MYVIAIPSVSVPDLMAFMVTEYGHRAAYNAGTYGSEASALEGLGRLRENLGSETSSVSRVLLERLADAVIVPISDETTIEGTTLHNFPMAVSCQF